MVTKANLMNDRKKYTENKDETNYIKEIRTCLYEFLFKISVCIAMILYFKIKNLNFITWFIYFSLKTKIKTVYL